MILNSDFDHFALHFDRARALLLADLSSLDFGIRAFGAHGAPVFRHRKLLQILFRRSEKKIKRKKEKTALEAVLLFCCRKRARFFSFWKLFLALE